MIQSTFNTILGQIATIKKLGKIQKSVENVPTATASEYERIEQQNRERAETSTRNALENERQKARRAFSLTGFRDRREDRALGIEGLKPKQEEIRQQRLQISNAQAADLATQSVEDAASVPRNTVSNAQNILNQLRSRTNREVDV